MINFSEIIITFIAFILFNGVLFEILAQRMNTGFEIDFLALTLNFVVFISLMVFNIIIGLTWFVLTVFSILLFSA